MKPVYQQNLEESMQIRTGIIKRKLNIYLHKPVRQKLLNKFNINELVDYLKKNDLISEERYVPNDVHDSGEIWLAELLAQKYTDDTAIGAPLSGGLQFIAVGTSNAAIDQNHYDLQGAIAQTDASKAATNLFAGASGNNKFTCSATFADIEPAGLPYTLYEAGIFAKDRNGFTPGSEFATNNRMFNRTIFSLITKTDAFQLTLQWTIEIGSLS